VNTDTLNKVNSSKLKKKLKTIFQKNREKQEGYQRNLFNAQFSGARANKLVWR